MDDDALLEHFERGTLEQFSHADHVRVAFLLTRTVGPSEALERMRRGIQYLAELGGDPGKYHETITVAWIRLVGGLVRRAGAADTASFDAFVSAHPELLRRDVLLEYYDRELLFSDLARREFIEPDRRPLP
jgi:hypothetical protein